MSDINALLENAGVCGFHPVQCTQKTLDSLPSAEGYMYFTTDTKKIYLGKSNGKLDMCANTGIFYGTKDIKYVNNGLTPDPNVSFIMNEIEGNDWPEVNDLILNKDGCFYRVKSINVEIGQIFTERLTLQGTGSGGGGGGGSSDGGSYNIGFSNISKSYTFSSVSNEMLVGVVGWRSNTADNYISSITFSLKDSKEPFKTEFGPLEFNKLHYINLAPYKHLLHGINNTIRVKISDKFGESREDDINIKLVTISLEKAKPTLLPALTSELDFVCNLSGGTGSDVSNKKIVYTFYKEENPTQSVLTLEQVLNVNEVDKIPSSLNLSTLDHGIYILTVQAFVNIAGTIDPVPSNILTHKIGYIVDNTSSLLLTLPPEVTEQYTDIDVKYLYITSGSAKTYTAELKVNNVWYKTITIVPNEESEYSFYFEDAGTKRIQFIVLETGITSTFDITLTPYTGNLPLIDATRADLMLYLNPKGKTNNDIDKNIWVDAKGGQLTAYLNGVSYSEMDGWCIDEETGDTYLKLISGATLTMPDFKPFTVDHMGHDGMTIELDFEVNGITDMSSQIMSCISYTAANKPAVGFELVGNKFKMYSRDKNGVTLDEKIKSSLVSQTIVEGKRVKLSIVIDSKTGDNTNGFPMCYTYLNGKVSESVKFDATDAFLDSTRPATLVINSQEAQIKIYSIRFYNSRLGESLILNNYTASLPTLEERQKVYDSNSVYSGTKIDFNAVSDSKYDLGIPYMVLTGGYKCSANDKWTLDTTADVGLPTGKKDYRLVDIKVVYPKYVAAVKDENGNVIIPAKNEYFAGYTDQEFINIFSNGLGMADNLGKRPSNGGAIMYCQGTSSMEYPVKNLRLRWKNDADFFTVRPNLPDVEIVCMKADYMESSGSHNTGAANLIDKLYAGAGMKTPGQAKNWNGEQWISGKETVTCIKGHPCLIFYSETGAPNSYEYIGKYNLNLDKATPEPFGFYHDDEDNFGYLKDEQGNVVLDENGNKQNSIFCYEFLDNAAYPVCNFLVTSLPDQNGDIPTNYHDTWYKTFWHEKDKKYYPGWRMGFESRYPEDEEKTHSADAFYPLANWINDLYHLRSGLGIYENAADENAALNRFKNEYWKYLDKDFTLAYYLITEALLMADSRVKNMMIATWGKEWRYRLSDGTITKEKPNKGNAVEGIPTGDNYNEHFGYIFYPIFYDMDTMLGLNNEGKMTFEYYTEDTEEGVYNGANVLWHLVRDSLPKELIIAYSNLEKAGLHAPLILPYFNQNQANMANEAFYNGDADYKYITPARYGYEDLLNGTTIAPGAAPYLYALQGDRALHRESFINDRMQFLRGKYISDKFLEGDLVAFRWYTPTYIKDDNSKESISAKAIPPLDAKGKSVFHFTGLKHGFAGVQLGKNGVVYANKFTPNSEHDFVLSAAQADGTEAYLLGLSALSDVGDLSNKYMSKFVISSPDNRLERLTLGNPNKFYYNSGWAKGSEDIVIDSPYLEYFNLQNCSTYAKTIDLRNNPVIKQVLMTGSGVTTLHLPENGVLTELKLPNTLKALKIVGHKTLLDSGFEMGTYKYGSDDIEIDEDFDYQADYNLIDGEGGSYIDDFSALTDLHLENTNIDTYRVLKGARFLEKYYLHGIDWQMSEVDPDQYCKRSSDWIYDYDEENNPIALKDIVPAGVYYTYNADSDEYEFYMGTQYPEDDTLYEKVSMLDDDNNIICIPMLEKLLTLNSRSSDPIHSESLSGTINISIPGTKVIELNIYDKYKDNYPNINIEYDDSKVDVEKAYIINFYPGATDLEYVESVGSIEGLTPGVTTRTAQSAKTLAELIGDYTPIKIQTIANTFTFTGEWVDWADKNKTRYYQHNVPSGKEAFAFTVFKPAADMELVPVFSTNVRYYNVTLYNYNNNILVQESLPYNATIYGGLLNKNIPEGNLNYVYRDDSDIEDVENYRWMFQGWINEKDHLNNTSNPEYYNLSTINIASDFKAYAYYKLENVHDVATPNKYFDFASVSINDSLLGNETYSGYSISIKDIYRNIIQGKITLPDKYNNTNVIEIGDFTEMTGITHVYFKNKENCNYIQTRSQKGFGLLGLENNYLKSNLKVVDLPPSFRLLNNCAFQGCNNLTTINLNNNILRIGNYALGLNTGQYGAGKMRMVTNIKSLPTGLLELGEHAFLGNATNLEINSLPKGLKTIPSYCFCWCSNVAINQLGGDIGSSILTAIHDYAFYGTGSGVETLTIGPSIAIIGNNAFFNAYPSLTTLNLGRRRDSYIDENGDSSSLLNMGFKLDNLTVNEFA